MAIYPNIRDGQLKNWHKAIEFCLRVPYSMVTELLDDVPTPSPPATWT